MSKFNVGDMVIMTRKPTDDDWESIGIVQVPKEYYEKPHKITGFSSINPAIKLEDSDYLYPSSCFELAHDHAAEQYKKDVQKQALLKHAKQNYPPGTRFINRMGSITTVAHDPQYVHSNSDKGVYLRSVHGTLVYVYHEGKWADIMSSSVQAKKGDYIKIVHDNGYTGLKGGTFYVVDIIYGDKFELARIGKGEESQIRWACANPEYYEIVQSSQLEPTPKKFRVGDRVKVTGAIPPYFNVGEISVIEKIEGTSIKMHSNKTGYSLWIGDNDIEHTDEYPRVEIPIVYNVGDTVIGLPSANRYAWTKEGWEGVIKRINDGGESFDAASVIDGHMFHGLEFQHFTLKASKSEGLRYKIDLPTFDHGSLTQRLSELQKEYFKQIKNPENGTENQQSVKLQGVNLKI